jgi:hypothetical protein
MAVLKGEYLVFRVSWCSNSVFFGDSLKARVESHCQLGPAVQICFFCAPRRPHLVVGVRVVRSGAIEFDFLASYKGLD